MPATAHVSSVHRSRSPLSSAWLSSVCSLTCGCSRTVATCLAREPSGLAAGLSQQPAALYAQLVAPL